MNTPEHRDFLAEVPAYRYDLPCGHHVFYRTPVALDDYGYCRSCHAYFVHDETVTEHPPRNTRRRLSDNELTVLIDNAVIKNRIADLLVETEGDSEFTYETIAVTVGASPRTVWSVARDLGMTTTTTESEEVAA